MGTLYVLLIFFCASTPPPTPKQSLFVDKSESFVKIEGRDNSWEH